VRYPTIVADNLWYLSKWRPFWRSPVPQTPDAAGDETCISSRQMSYLTMSNARCVLSMLLLFACLTWVDKCRSTSSFSAERFQSETPVSISQLWKKILLQNLFMRKCFERFAQYMLADRTTDMCSVVGFLQQAPLGLNLVHRILKEFACTILQISCALQHVLRAPISPESGRGETVDGNRHRTLATALVRMGCMLDVEAPKSLGIDPYRWACFWSLMAFWAGAIDRQLPKVEEL